MEKVRKIKGPIKYNFKIESSDEFFYHITEKSDNSLEDQLKFLCLPEFKVYGNDILMAYGSGENVEYTDKLWERKFKKTEVRQRYVVTFINGDSEVYTAREFDNRFGDYSLNVGNFGPEQDLYEMFCVTKIERERAIVPRKYKKATKTEP